MRVLFLNYEYPPIGGGGANANAYLFREFAAFPELTIDCVTSSLGGEDEVVKISDRITLYRLAVGKKDLHFWRQQEVLTWLWRADSFCRKLVAEKDYDLCHGFFGFPSGAVAWRLKDRFPYIVSLRGSDVPGFNPRFSTQYVLLKPLFRRIWRGAGAVIANSDGLRRLAACFEPQLAIPVIPNGIDVSEFSLAEAVEREPGQILCVSRLVERKGVQHLIAAMPGIVRRYPDARLTIIGEGNLQQELQKLAHTLELAEKVTFLGYVAHEVLPGYYRRAQLFAQPSYYEGMSNTVLEAMASGLPIVVSGEGGGEELYRGNARVVPYGDVEALATTIGELLADGATLRQMSAESRTLAEGFSWKAVAEGYYAYYHKVVDGGSD